jgi:hypothetical protein
VVPIYIRGIATVLLIHEVMCTRTADGRMVMTRAEDLAKFEEEEDLF